MTPPLSDAQRQRIAAVYQLQARATFLRLALVWYKRRLVPSHFFLKEFDEHIARWVMDTADPSDAPQSLPLSGDATNAAPTRLPLPDVIRQALLLLRPELSDLTQQLAADGVRLPIDVAADAFSLSPLERDLLQLALSCLLDPRIGGLCSAIRGRPDLTHPTLQLALELLAPAADERAEALSSLLASPPLLSHRLLSIGAHTSRFHTNATPFLERDLLLPEPIARFLLEPLSPPQPPAPAQDLKLSSILTPAFTLDQLALPDDFLSDLGDLISVDHARRALILSAKPGNGAPELAEAICHHLQRPVCWINPAVVQSADPTDWFDTLLQHLSEASLRGAIPAVRLDRLPRHDAQEPSPLQAHDAHLRQSLELALARWPGPLTLFIAPDPPPPLSPQILDRPILSLAIPDLNRHTRATFWRRALPPLASLPDDHPDLNRLAHLPTNRHQILSVIRQLSLTAPTPAPEPAPEPAPAPAPKPTKRTSKKAAPAPASAPEPAPAPVPAPAIDFARLDQLCQQELNQTLAGFGKRVIPKESWSTLILPDETTEQLHELIARAKHHDLIFETWGMQRRFARGGGLTALFSGPPGTGKTTAVEILAVELGVTLYRVDMSRLVSKYVGETEGNIGQIFSQAAESGALLLFDEADSLFAKRTEVKTSMDRYSNQMVNYLLERLEAYSGVAVLTTNLPKSIDDAFQRRIAIHVKFPEPTVDERVTMWRHFFPPEAPLDDAIDWYKLGHAFELTGGHIKNAAMRAAVLAAHRNTYIDEDVLFEAASREYRAMGRLIRF